MDRTHKKGGGLAIYIKSFLNPMLHAKFKENVLSVSIRDSTNKHFLILVVYRLPHTNILHDEILYNYLTSTMKDKACIIMGDFNCRNVNWENQSGDREAETLLNFINDNFLFQHVKEPTRLGNILDLVLTTDEDLIREVKIRENIGTSDHMTVEFCICINKVEPKFNVMTFDYRKANWGAIKRGVSDISIPIDYDAAQSWIFLKTKLLDLTKQFIPVKKQLNKLRQPKWFNDDVKRAIRDKARKHKIYKTQLTDETYREFCTARRVANKAIRKAKFNEEERITETAKVSPKEFYGYVNSKKPTVREIGPLKNPNGVLATAPRDIASILNNYFCTVFQSEDLTNIPDPVIYYEGDSPLINILITPQMVEKKINKLNQYKTPGPDEIPARILKVVSDELVQPLTNIFNASLDSGNLPVDWKIANVTPIFKKGQPELPSNYRPISLTSTTGKVLESIITDHIIRHLETNNLFLSTQHGFRKKRSCLTNLLEFFHVIFNEYDKFKSIDLIYLDFQKAFDKVPHIRLMRKVRALGIDGAVARWIENWLNKREQRVVLQGIESEWKSVISGVPQGSVLGPLLFLIYINDIDIGLTSTLVKFADDMKLGCKVVNERDVNGLQHDLDLLPIWTDKWLMQFNVDKCKVMHIGNNNPNHIYRFFGGELTTSSCERDLGVFVCDNFKFSKQCIAAEKKAMKILGFIKRSFYYKSEKLILTLFKSLVRPHLEYAVQFWCPYLKKDIERLERVQARATKMIPHLRKISYKRRLVKLNMFSLETRRLRGELIQAFKIIRGFDNVDANKFFNFCNINTRNNGYKIKLPIAKTQPLRNFFTYKVINHWNKLPYEIVSSKSVDTFKLKIDKILPIG